METITNYINAWNAEEATERKEFLEKSFSENGRYIDPHIPEPVENLEQMRTIIETFRERLPHKLTLIGEPEFHNHAFRLNWKMAHNEEILSKGIFVGELDKNNKIENLICFIDK